jgi:hypothetical protein
MNDIVFNNTFFVFFSDGVYLAFHVSPANTIRRILSEAMSDLLEIFYCVSENNLPDGLTIPYEADVSSSLMNKQLTD